MPTPPRLGDGTTPDLTTVHFACVNCGGQLVFHPPTRGMKCPSCGGERPIEASEEKPAERDLLATLEDQRKPPSAQAVTSGPQKELVCPNCNGHIGFVGSLTATRCPFCASPVQRSDIHEAPNRLPVDGVVPFGIDTKAAEEKVKDWINGRWFAPNDFKKYSKTGSFTGVYLPFFTFDAQTYTEYEGERGDTYTVTVGTGQNRRTETRIRWRHVRGAVDVPFDDVAIGAENSLDPERLRALEPWPTQAAVAFRPEYLAGSMSRFYEKELELCHSEAVQRMNNDIAYAIRRDIGGDHQRIHRTDTTWSRQTYRHLLLPIFLLVVMFHAKPYQVFVNGVTGEVHGERPYSWVKITLAVIAALIVVGIGLGIYYGSK
ncbi:hypothetical protein GCM10009547_10670 [Sporichthya brevicatena]|uniref:Uncharacterized protein n=1 Tax=Sporichthya brevicatena TaxID=171442 RepID=A0ABN1GFM3_9ACTN